MIIFFRKYNHSHYHNHNLRSCKISATKRRCFDTRNIKFKNETIKRNNNNNNKNSMLRSAPPQRALGIVVALFCGSVLASATPPPRPRVDPRTGKFQLADGRTADFRGACVTESSVEQDVPGLVSLSDEKLRWFADLGLNTLRVGVHWSLYETAPRVYNETYLAEIVALFGRLHTHGLWAIVDMHQDQWSGYYCAGHGVPAFYAAPPATAVYGAGGARAYPQPIAPPSFGNASQVT